MFIKGHVLFKPIVNNTNSQPPKKCLPVEKIIFGYLRVCESFDLSTIEPIPSLNSVSSMVIPYLLEHGLVPRDRVDVYQRNLADKAYERMKKLEWVVDKIINYEFETKVATLRSMYYTGNVSNSYIDDLLSEVIVHLFEIETMDATKKEYHLNHEFSFKKDLMDCLRHLIKIRIGNIDDAKNVIRDIEENWQE